MSTMTEAEAKALADDLTRKVSEVQQVGHTNASAMADLKKGFEAVRQAVDTLKIERANRFEGDDRDLDVYLEGSDTVRRFGPEAYAELDGRHVRMVSHEVRTEDSVGRAFGLLDDPYPMSQEQGDLQKAVEELVFTRRVLHAWATKGNPHARVDVSHLTPRLNSRVRRAASRMGPEVRRIFADSSAIGAEWMAEQVAPSFEREVLAAMGASSVVPVMSHPGGTLKLPYESGFLQVFKESAPSADDPSNTTGSSIATGSNSIDCVESAVAAQLYRPSVEDAVVAILPVLQADMVRAFADADDLSLFHGDTAGTQDTIASWDPRGRIATKTAGVHLLTRWDGARKKAIAASTDVNLAAAQDYAGLISLISALGVEQYVDGRGSRLCMFVNPEWFLATGMHLTEFKTDSTVGQLASVLTGALGSDQGGNVPNQVGTLIGNIPLALSYALTTDLNASGVYDNVTTTKGGAVLLDRFAWENWVRRGVMVERDVNIRNNTVDVVARKSNVYRVKRLGTGQAAASFGYGLS